MTESDHKIKNIMPCIFCGGVHTEIEEIPNVGFRVVCNNSQHDVIEHPELPKCNAIGPIRETEEQAINIWNQVYNLIIDATSVIKCNRCGALYDIREHHTFKQSEKTGEFYPACPTCSNVND